MRKVKIGVYLSVLLVALFTSSLICVIAQTGPGTANIRLRDAMDFDGNNRADFNFFRPSEKKWHVYKNENGGCSNKCLELYSFDGFPNDEILTPGDYDGDGKGDISVWRRKPTGQCEWHRILSSTGTLVVTYWGLWGDEPVGRDYDGDGKTDLAVVRRENNGQMTWHVLKSIDGGYSTAQWGLSTDFAVPGDYDGDGKFDFTVQRIGPLPSSPSTFYSLKSSNGGVEILNWGAGDDRAVPGDYDGDGKTDYAVVREWDMSNPNLIWSIRKSSNGSLLQISYGLTCRNGVQACDANLTQNDYDGDGKTDLSVWRTSASTGTLFYLLSSSNFQNSSQFQLGVSTDYPIASYDSH